MPNAILLSAYACDPAKGSEHAVGWNWAMELTQQGHEVWVLTREKYRDSIETWLSHHAVPNLHVVYLEPPAWAASWRREHSDYPYYFLWQLAAYRRARALASRIRFDWVQHVTYVSIRVPSFMGLLGIPFVFGPVAGGEYAPLPLRRRYPLRGWLIDFLRDASNAWVRLDPLMNLTFASASSILVTSEQSKALIPRRYRSKASVQLAIGFDGTPSPPAASRSSKGFRVLFVGKLLYWKGLHLAFSAFARHLETYPDARFTVIGTGGDERWLHRVADRLGIAHAVEWVDWMSRQELLEAYSNYDVFLFPSLHDSGGMAVLEALASGLPVVCLDLGGPGIVVDPHCGMVVSTAQKGEAEVVEALSSALDLLARDPDYRQALSAGARARVATFTWRNVIARAIARQGGASHAVHST